MKNKKKIHLIPGDPVNCAGGKPGDGCLCDECDHMAKCFPVETDSLQLGLVIEKKEEEKIVERLTLEGEK